MTTVISIVLSIAALAALLIVFLVIIATLGINDDQEDQNLMENFSKQAMPIPVPQVNISKLAGSYSFTNHLKEAYRLKRLEYYLNKKNA